MSYNTSKMHTVRVEMMFRGILYKFKSFTSNSHSRRRRRLLHTPGVYASWLVYTWKCL